MAGKWQRPADCRDATNRLNRLDQVDVYAVSFRPSQRQPVTADRKFQGIAQRGRADVRDGFVIRQAHFHQTNRDGVFADDVEYAGRLSGRELAEGQHTTEFSATEQQGGEIGGLRGAKVAGL